MNDEQQYSTSKLLVLALCLLACSSRVCAAQSKCASLADGETSGHTYTNKEIGLSYTFPESLRLEPAAKYPKDKTGRLLLVLWKSPPDLPKPSVLILADDPSAYRDATAIGYARRIENTVRSYDPPGTITQNAKEYDVAGVKFYRVEYQFPQPNPAYNVAITGQVRNCEISFEFTGRTKQEIEALIPSIDAIRFSNPSP